MKEKIELNNKTILVTGSPGFIGANLVMRLLSDSGLMSGGIIISLDNLNNYYSTELKEYRLELINSLERKSENLHIFVKGDISNCDFVQSVFEEHRPDIVVNLAAQAGVRHSINYPKIYIESNIVGFYNILEACRHSYDNKTSYRGVRHLIYASSSSVYGGNEKVPFSVNDIVDYPVSLYAATKKSDELLAHCYSKLYNIPSTGLRLFTVYGPAGRPDMFYYSAAQRLERGEKIKIFNYGKMMRDFTYVDDIVEGIVRVMKGAPIRSRGEDGLPVPPYELYNIGGGRPENLLDFIAVLQEQMVLTGILPPEYDFEGHRELVAMQPGDVPITYADSSKLEEDYGFRPKTDIRTGLRAFCEWYKEYYC